MEYKKHKPITRIPEYRSENQWNMYDLWKVGFKPNVDSLIALHKEIFLWDPVIGQLSWELRITYATARGYSFIRPENIRLALIKSFDIQRNTPYEILAWCIDTIWWIHPFYDGNRRCIWEFTNRWLMSKWYRPLNWEMIHSIWDTSITEDGNLRLEKLCSIYIH